MSENINPASDTPGDAAAAGQQPNVNLTGDDAVARAAEQWKGTSARNIPGLGELPIADDTANLREGPSLNDGLLALLPLIGVWRGSGQADTPDGGQYAFGQEIVFSHDGQNYIKYESRTWKLDDEGNSVGPDEREVGFWRINLEDEIEVVVTHASGAVEIYYGQPVNERAWQVESASTMVTATGPANLGPGRRLYGLMPNNNLGWVDERLMGEDMHPRMSAELQRVIG